MKTSLFSWSFVVIIFTILVLLEKNLFPEYKIIFCVILMIAFALFALSMIFPVIKEEINAKRLSENMVRDFISSNPDCREITLCSQYKKGSFFISGIYDCPERKKYNFPYGGSLSIGDYIEDAFSQLYPMVKVDWQKK